jgi:hypothetical protein
MELCVGERIGDDCAERLAHDPLPPVGPRQFVAHLGASELLVEEEEATGADDDILTLERDAPADALALRVPLLALNQIA